MYPVTRRSIFDILLVIVAIIVVATLLTSNLSVAPARAAGPIGDYFKQPAIVTSCNTFSLGTNIPVYENVPADGKTYTYTRASAFTDGTHSSSIVGGPTLLSPTAGEIYVGFIVGVGTGAVGPLLTQPFTTTLTSTTFANGVVVNVSTVVIRCAGNVGTIISLTSGGTADVTGAPCLFTDGRINCRAEDAAETAAIYCTGDGSVTIWAINSSSVGKFAFTATKAEIARVPANPDKNTLIKQAQNIALYRLHGGKLQVNAPNGYVFIWDGC